MYLLKLNDCRTEDLGNVGISLKKIPFLVTFLVCKDDDQKFFVADFKISLTLDLNFFFTRNIVWFFLLFSLLGIHEKNKWRVLSGKVQRLPYFSANKIKQTNTNLLSLDNLRKLCQWCHSAIYCTTTKKKKSFCKILEKVILSVHTFLPITVMVMMMVSMMVMVVVYFIHNLIPRCRSLISVYISIWLRIKRWGIRWRIWIWSDWLEKY